MTKKVERIKTRSIERQFSVFKSSVIAGTRYAGASAKVLFQSKEKRQATRKAALSEQAHYLVEELGKLKGSIVKVGQLMAMLGEHFLPAEVTEALHTLENQTTALDWSIIEAKLINELGSKFELLEVETTPIGAASLAQVHKAIVKKTGQIICLKVLYPGVSNAIDSDLNSIVKLLSLTRLVPITTEFNEWVNEIRISLKREVNYELEKQNLKDYAHKLQHDCRFAVPEVFDEFCGNEVLAMSFEEGVHILDDSVVALPQNRRNSLGQAIIELCLREVFEWEAMQTDPNFGNFLIRHTPELSHDVVVLLDFGAIRPFDKDVISAGQQMLIASYKQDIKQLESAIKSIGFIPHDAPQNVIESFAKVCFTTAEIFSTMNADTPETLIDNDGNYHWGASDLPSRLVKKASKYALSKHFSMPPSEFVFLMRKFVGIFTFLSVLDAQTNIAPQFETYSQNSRPTDN